MTYDNYAALGLELPSPCLVDRLGDAHAKMKEAEQAYQDLRQQVVNSRLRNGDFYKLDIQFVTKRHANLELLEARFGRQAINECCDLRDQTIVRIKRQ